MYCPNCGKDLVDNSKFCSECGFKIILIKQRKIKNEKQSILKLDFLFCIIFTSILFISNFIIGKTITGANNLFIKLVISQIIIFLIQTFFLVGLLFASNEIQKKKNVFSIISIIASCLYIVYYIITTSVSFIKFLVNNKKDSFDLIDLIYVPNVTGSVFLLIGLILVLFFIFQKKQVLRNVSIIVFILFAITSLLYSTIGFVYLNRLIKETNSFTSSISESYSNNSKITGTWNVWLRYDDPDQRYSQYDNLYSKRTRFCDKDYAIQKAKEWLLIDHPHARNIYVEDCIFEGYSTRPID